MVDKYSVPCCIVVDKSPMLVRLLLIACDSLRCTSCDFKVSIFRDFAWDPSTNYLFLRNNMPDFEKVRSKLKVKRGWCAYGCQCHAMSVNVFMEMKKASHVKWVCAGH
ncbi:protein C8orf37 homolog [Trichonephila inaurata madagascariensis]|uniref:Cilia- and flagella-associated protein 418 n=1 Tax=Trichonephila inaurata madagascariensis TaxID=2747483 RepID=A0A8X6YT47_9ARAC|nr:protein C8orf37 homolog [Trichonephila inaurata madagascariensis]